MRLSRRNMGTAFANSFGRGKAKATTLLDWWRVSSRQGGSGTPRFRKVRGPVSNWNADERHAWGLQASEAGSSKTPLPVLGREGGSHVCLSLARLECASANPETIRSRGYASDASELHTRSVRTGIGRRRPWSPEWVCDAASLGLSLAPSTVSSWTGWEPASPFSQRAPDAVQIIPAPWGEHEHPYLVDKHRTLIRASRLLRLHVRCRSFFLISQTPRSPRGPESQESWRVTRRQTPLGLRWRLPGATSYRLPSSPYHLRRGSPRGWDLSLLISAFPYSPRYQNANTSLARLPASIDTVSCLSRPTCAAPQLRQPLETGIGVGWAPTVLRLERRSSSGLASNILCLS